MQTYYSLISSKTWKGGIAIAGPSYEIIASDGVF